MGKILEALEAAGGLFEVRKTGLYTANFNNVQDFVGVENADTGDFLGVTGRTRELLSHADAFRAIDNGLGALEDRFGPATVTAETYKKKRRETGNLLTGNVANVKVEFRSLNVATSQIPSGPKLFPTLQLRHGIAGEASLEALGGIFNEVCSNGLTIGERKLIRRLRHTSGIRYKLEGLESVIHAAMHKVVDLEKIAGVGSNLPVNGGSVLADSLRFILTGSMHETDRKPKGYDDLEQAYFTAPGADPGSVWGLFQAATYRATHQGRGVNPLAEARSPGADKLRSRARSLCLAAIEEGSISNALCALTA